MPELERRNDYTEMCQTIGEFRDILIGPPGKPGLDENVRSLTVAITALQEATADFREILVGNGKRGLIQRVDTVEENAQRRWASVSRLLWVIIGTIFGLVAFAMRGIM